MTIEKSTHKCEVIRITEIKDHENADRLSVISNGGYQTVVRKGDFKIGDLAVFIPPDSIVKTSRPEFSFLKVEGRDTCRIKAKKLRGIVSMGLLIKAPHGQEGDDLAEYLEVEHYEPEEKFSTDTGRVKPPSIYAPKYDIDSIRKYTNIFKDREPVMCSEKVHGCNSKYVFCNEMYCGFRTIWSKEDPKSIVWRALYNTPSIIEFCKDNPNTILYGESYGQVQNLKYGKNDVFFAAFDILAEGKWLDVKDFLGVCEKYSIPTVPILALDIPFDYATMESMSNGPSLVPGANHHREGAVIRPMIEGWNEEIGRKILKLVGTDYLCEK